MSSGTSYQVGHSTKPRMKDRFQTAWTVIRKRPLMTASTLVIAAYVGIGLLAPLIAPYDYAVQAPEESLLPPGSEGHLLGTDEFGRDVLTRLMFGARTSLTIASGVTAIAVLGGLILGSLSGYIRGTVDTVISHVLDVIWSFPNILVAILFVAIIGPGIFPVMIAIGLTNCASMGRIVRGEALSLRERDFVRAAISMERRHPYIIARHIIPNMVAPILVMASFYMGFAIVTETVFSFIGIGVQPPSPSWGTMLASGRDYIFLNHWLVTIPGISIVIIVLAFNILGDELRDILDPRMRGGEGR